MHPAATPRSAAATSRTASARCGCRRACASSGTTGRTADARTYTLRYRLRGVVIAHDDAVEVAPQVWGDQWDFGLPLLLANVQAAGAPTGTRAWIEPAWLTHRVNVSGGLVLTTAEDVPTKHSVILRVLYPPSVLEPNATYARHVHDNVLESTIAREQRLTDNAERDRRELQDTLDHPWAWIIAAGLLALVPAGLLGAFGYMRFGREHTDGHGAGVRAPAARRPAARARALAARAAGRCRRRTARGDALRARPPRPLHDDARHSRGVVVRRPAPQGGRRCRPRARRREHRAGRRRETRRRDLRQTHDRGPDRALEGVEDRQGPAHERPRVVPRALRGVRVGSAQPGPPTSLLERSRDAA